MEREEKGKREQREERKKREKKEREKKRKQRERENKIKEREKKREQKEEKRAEMERRVNERVESILEEHKFETIERDRRELLSKRNDVMKTVREERQSEESQREESQRKESQREEKERRANIIAKRDEDVVNIVNTHIETLVRKRKQKVIKDDYGNIDDSKWKEEKEYFFDNVIKKNRYKVFGHKKTLELIDTLLDEFEENNSSNYSESMSPYDYEYYCASVLKENGWIAETTRGSGDQGVDVIATKNNYRVVLQCKKYSSPVGNKAVQEAFSAKSHIGADYAIVVTNHTYTKSAKELASTTGVILLHHSELKVLSF